MTYINNLTKYIFFAGMTLVFIFGIVSIAPTQTNACIKVLGFLDPLCVIKGKVNLPALPPLPPLPDFPDLNSNDVPQTVNYTNSNNTNSNINSPGATIGDSQSIAYNTTPIYNYNTYPSYNYPQYNQGPLQVSCYPQPLSARTGESISWRTSAYGGNGSYYFTWTGTDGLSGYGSSISKTYYSSGYKNASVTVSSGGQTISRNCDGSVNVYGDYYNQSYQYYPPTNYNYYAPLSVTCRTNTTFVNTGTSITWNAYPSGGNGNYSYSWTGTDGLYGSSQSIYKNYPYVGMKYATVTVYSDGQSASQSCGSVNVGAYVSQYPVYVTGVSTNNGGLDIACYSDPRTVSVNQPANWITEVTGGIAPYTYTWTGSDDLSGNTSTVTKYYGTVGNKTAIISVKSSDGRSETRACSTSLTVRSISSAGNGSGTNAVPTPAKDTNVNADNGLSAAALFSLKNVPWGWVAILIILVLFGTVVYLLFNRPKI